MVINMDTFTEILKQWQFFYSTVSAASATLTGLLFVAISINPQKLSNTKHRGRLQSARSAFGDFLYVIMIGLIFLVPQPIPFGFSFALTVLGLARAIGVLRMMNRTRKKVSLDFKENLRLFALPIFSSLGLLAIAISVLWGFYNAIFAMVLVIAALLIMASWHAWDILFFEKEN